MVQKIRRRKAFSYIRFSSPEQAKGESVKRQERIRDKYCKDNNLDLQPFTYRDLGVSAFRGKNADEGALKALIVAIKSGRIEKGSVIIVENLDRLSRQKIQAALSLFLDLLGYVDIVALIPTPQVYTSESDAMQIIVAVTILSRGNEESEVKSIRVADACEERRKNLHKEKYSALCPLWLELDESRTKFNIVHHQETVVKLIFKLCINGWGAGKITKYLNATYASYA